MTIHKNTSSTCDDQELNDLLQTAPERCSPDDCCEEVSTPNSGTTGFSKGDAKAANPFQAGLCQWAIHSNGDIVVPAAMTVDRVPPGYYRPQESMQTGFFLERIPLRTEGLLEFPHTNHEIIVGEITRFWEREAYFREFDLAFKRGILLWGPPGSGKSCLSLLLARDVIARGGVVLEFNGLLTDALRHLDNIQPGTPKLVLMEDIEALLDRHESSILNVLDGAQRLDKIVFLATTNYPERLQARIVNRPSRFDKRFKIGLPTEASRRLYLESLVVGHEEFLASCGAPVDVAKWARETENFSLAHLKELFVAVVIIGNEYEAALTTLKSMNEKISSEQDKVGRAGFRS